MGAGWVDVAWRGLGWLYGAGNATFYGWSPPLRASISHLWAPWGCNRPKRGGIRAIKFGGRYGPLGSNTILLLSATWYELGCQRSLSYRKPVPAETVSVAKPGYK